MPQLAVRHNVEVGGLDLVREGASLKMDDGYITAETFSLKCKKRASVRGGPPIHGWWADPTLGSKLWTLVGEPINRDTAARARTENIDALQWMVNAKLCTAVEVETEVRPNMILGRTILRKRGESADEIRQWQLTEEEFAYA
jgi:phage gp46-like protein